MESLLEYLKKKTGAEYISDLKGASIKKEDIYNVVINMEPEAYSLKEWETALRYLLNIRQLHFESAKAAYQFLCGQLMLEISHSDRSL